MTKSKRTRRETLSCEAAYIAVREISLSAMLIRREQSCSIIDFVTSLKASPQQSSKQLLSWKVTLIFSTKVDKLSLYIFFVSVYAKLSIGHLNFEAIKNSQSINRVATIFQKHPQPINQQKKKLRASSFYLNEKTITWEKKKKKKAVFSIPNSLYSPYIKTLTVALISDTADSCQTK